MAEAHLYRHFAEDGTLLYVGVSLSAVQRIGQHRSKAGWFSDIARVGIERFETMEQALKAESLAIKMEKPLHNIRHAGRAAVLDADSQARVQSMIDDGEDGREFRIDSLSDLGCNFREIATNLAFIVETGATVHVSDVGETFRRNSPLNVVVNAILSTDKTKKRVWVESESRALSESTVKRGPKPKLVGAAKDRARALYGDLSKSIREVSEETGISPTQLRRIFKDRENPVGSKPKTPPTE